MFKKTTIKITKWQNKIMYIKITIKFKLSKFVLINYWINW